MAESAPVEAPIVILQSTEAAVAPVSPEAVAAPVSPVQEVAPVATVEEPKEAASVPIVNEVETAPIAAPPVAETSKSAFVEEAPAPTTPAKE